MSPAGFAWLAAGLVLLGLETVLPGAQLLWIGLAAAGTGLFVLAFAPGFGGAVAAFVALLALSLGASFALRARRRRRSGEAGAAAARGGVNAPEAGLVGRRGVVVGADEGGALRVRLGDSDWSARPAPGGGGGGGDVPPPPGALVRVEAVEGTLLVVRPV